MAAAPPTHQSRTPLFALVAVVVILGAAFGFYYFQASGSIASKDQTISSQSSEIASQLAQISADNSQIANLNSQVSSDQAMITSLTSGYARANQTIASLNSQITTLNSQISSDLSQISSLQSQVSSLQIIAALTDSTSLVSSQTFTTNSSGVVLLTTFTAKDAGYVLVSVTSASDAANMGPEVKMTFASNVQGSYRGMIIPALGFFYSFSQVPDALPIPVTPGTVSVYLVTSDTSAQTATVSVIYYY